MNIKKITAVGVVNILSGLTSFIFFAAVARVLSAEEMGLFSLGLSIYSMILGFGFTGLDTTLNKLALVGNVSAIIEKSKKYFSIYLALALLAVIVLFFLKNYLNYRIFLFLILTLAISPCLFWLKTESVLIGLSENLKIFKIKLIDAIISILSTAGVFCFKATAESFYILFIISRCIVSIMSLYYTLTSLSKNKNLKMEKPLTYSDKEFEKDTIKLSALGIFTTGLGTLKHAILFNLSPVSLAIYYTSTKIPEKIKDYIKYVALIPVQIIFKQGEREIDRKIISKKISIVFYSSLLSLFLGVGAVVATILLYGGQYNNAESMSVTFIACLSLGPKISTCIFQYTEIFIKNTRNFIKETIIYTLMDLAFSLVLLYSFGSIGLVVASLTVSILNLYTLIKRFG